MAGVRVSSGYAVRVKLAVGDLVVYGTHGIGRIAAREPKVVLGEASEVILVEMDDGLTVTLPVERAHEQLRAVAGAADVGRVREILRADREISFDNWLSRRRATLEKLIAGDPVQLAEIVGDGAHRERLRRAKGNNAQLSPGEREIFVKARKLLAGEIALALDIQPAAAEDWIEEQLVRPS
jgi:CarD family transcriptional regulator